ncbi:AAA family ATPase [Neobacillus niacini]|uniref:AAA family ATPase n=1 Tax=Neobacillus niacini TaxID=86668 RepID=UPI000B116DB9|nr:AAA family ATPase [Neobacillus niacini]MEC1523912.1 AAA family ATPase [Neobacillus niacini]
MINGAYGVGKTSVAKELQKIINNSMIFDPEEVGYMLRNIISEDIAHPFERTDNFQDFELWKVLVVNVASLLKKTYNKNLIVPMTIFNKGYFEYIFTGFKEIDEKTYHFCLTANEETIHERLRKRGEMEGNWCFKQTRKCMDGFKDIYFEQFIDTDDVNINDIVKKIDQKVRSFH